MRNGLQALLIAPSPVMREAIVNGQQTCSIREGCRRYRPGPVMLCCHLEPWAVMAQVTRVRLCTFGQVTAKEICAAGFASRKDMVEKLKWIYPKLRRSSPVTVICWSDVQGKFVDNPGAHAEHLGTLSRTR